MTGSELHGVVVSQPSTSSRRSSGCKKGTCSGGKHELAHLSPVRTSRHVIPLMGRANANGSPPASCKWIARRRAEMPARRPTESAEQVVIARHLADHDQVENGVLAAAAKKPAMPTMTKWPACGSQPRPKPVQKQSQRPAAAAADHHRGPEHSARAAAADRQPVVRILPRATASRSRAKNRPACSAAGKRHRVLQDAVAEGQDSQSTSGFCPKQIIKRQADNPAQETRRWPA